MRTRVALAVAVLLAGCTMGPDYTRPKIDAPAEFRFEPKAVAETANTEWWKQYNDPVLEALIAEALANNRNVKIAAANVLQAAALLTQARSALFPQVGYSGKGERQKIPDTGFVAIIPNFPNPQTSYEALLSASWEIGMAKWRQMVAVVAVLLKSVIAATAQTDTQKAAFAAIDPLFEKFMQDEHVPGLVYGVVADGKLAYVRALGVQDTKTKTPVTPDTVFRIASM